MKFCPNCGTPTDGVFKFCANCGFKLELKSEEDGMEMSIVFKRAASLSAAPPRLRPTKAPTLLSGKAIGTAGGSLPTATAAMKSTSTTTGMRWPPLR